MISLDSINLSKGMFSIALNHSLVYPVQKTNMSSTQYLSTASKSGIDITVTEGSFAPREGGGDDWAIASPGIYVWVDDGDYTSARLVDIFDGLPSQIAPQEGGSIEALDYLEEVFSQAYNLSNLWDYSGDALPKNGAGFVIYTPDEGEAYFCPMSWIFVAPPPFIMITKPPLKAEDVNYLEMYRNVVLCGAQALQPITYSTLLSKEAQVLLLEDKSEQVAVTPATVSQSSYAMRYSVTATPSKPTQSMSIDYLNINIPDLATVYTLPLTGQRIGRRRLC